MKAEKGGKMTFSPQKVPAKPILVANRADSPPMSRPDQHSLLSVIGAFENDREYDALMEDVGECRRQLDAHENPEVD